MHKGDFVKTVTFRKVTNEHSTSKTTVKKKLNITIKIEEIEYDQESGEIRIKGKNVTENEFINVGQYQSASLTRGSQFTIFKKCWDSISIENLRIASDPTLTSDLCAIVMEEGLANIFLVSSHITTLKATVTLSIPKKRKGPSQHDKVNIVIVYIHNILMH